MRTLRRVLEITSENREAQKISKKDFLHLSQKRDVWNSRRRFGY